MWGLKIVSLRTHGVGKHTTLFTQLILNEL